MASQIASVMDCSYVAALEQSACGEVIGCSLQTPAIYSFYRSAESGTWADREAEYRLELQRVIPFLQSAWECLTASPLSPHNVAPTIYAATRLNTSGITFKCDPVVSPSVLLQCWITPTRWSHRQCTSSILPPAYSRKHYFPADKKLSLVKVSIGRQVVIESPRRDLQWCAVNRKLCALDIASQNWA